MSRIEKRSVFEQALMHSIDAALNTLGTSVKESILLSLKKRNAISVENLPSRIPEFMRALEETMGYGARVVEKLVIAGLVGTNHVAPDLAQGKRLVEIVKSLKSNEENARFLNEENRGPAASLH